MENGLTRKSKAPARIASTATSTVANAVMSRTSHLGDRPRT